MTRPNGDPIPHPLIVYLVPVSIPNSPVSLHILVTLSTPSVLDIVL